MQAGRSGQDVPARPAAGGWFLQDDSAVAVFECMVTDRGISRVARCGDHYEGQSEGQNPASEGLP